MGNHGSPLEMGLVDRGGVQNCHVGNYPWKWTWCLPQCGAGTLRYRQGTRYKLGILESRDCISGLDLGKWHRRNTLVSVAINMLSTYASTLPVLSSFASMSSIIHWKVGGALQSPN